MFSFLHQSAMAKAVEPPPKQMPRCKAPWEPDFDLLANRAEGFVGKLSSPDRRLPDELSQTLRQWEALVHYLTQTLGVDFVLRGQIPSLAKHDLLDRLVSCLRFNGEPYSDEDWLLPGFGDAEKSASADSPPPYHEKSTDSLATTRPAKATLAYFNAAPALREIETLVQCVHQQANATPAYAATDYHPALAVAALYEPLEDDEAQKRQARLKTLRSELYVPLELGDLVGFKWRLVLGLLYSVLETYDEQGDLAGQIAFCNFLARIHVSLRVVSRLAKQECKPQQRTQYAPQVLLQLAQLFVDLISTASARPGNVRGEEARALMAQFVAALPDFVDQSRHGDLRLTIQAA